MDKDPILDQPIKANPEGEAEESASPVMYDFSSDLNISPVKEDPAPKPAALRAALYSAAAALPKDNPLIQANKPPTPPAPPKPPTPPPTPPTPPTQTNTPASPAPTAKSPTTPSSSYREPIETAAEWPFASNKKAPEPTPKSAPEMSPTEKPTGKQEGGSLEKAPVKKSPSYAPVKTIYNGPTGNNQSEQDTQKDRPATDLQRDVLAILPNLKKDGTEQSTKQTSNETKTPALTPAPSTRHFDKSVTGTDIKSLRTYESDVAEALSRRKTSRASIAISEKVRETGEERISNRESADETPAQTPGTPSNILPKILYSLISLILIAGGAIGGYYLYTQSTLFSSIQPPAPQTAGLPEGILQSAQYSVISLDGFGPSQVADLIKEEASKPLTSGSIREIVPVRARNDGVRDQVSAQDMVSILGLRTPSILVRTLEDDWMMGVYADQNGTNNLFAVVRTNFFQNAFAGMLQWEISAAEELQSYIVLASSTPLRGNFSDKIIKNKDVRTFIAEDGSELLSYSFIDNSTLVIARSESAILEIISKLESQAYLR